MSVAIINKLILIEEQKLNLQSSFLLAETKE